ncbi:TorF family putative porin [Sphingomonas kyungheensis]|uniref:TorF family putative porin n=1 Tax=Sphingomonas kyungheensis TaxID=1069987 RepID=A0ABU8H5X4_9SPHN
MNLRHMAVVAAMVAYPAGAAAQDVAKPSSPQAIAEPPTTPVRPITVTGSVSVQSDYRLRGVSQSDDRPAVQGSLTIAHDSGLYVGTFASNLAGWGTFGGSNLELDAIGGYKHAFGSATVDAGLTWYMYPGGASKTDYAELFAKLSGTSGPATLLAGVAYAPSQQALGRWYDTGAEAAAGVYTHPGASHDNLYLWGDGGVAVPRTPITAKAHIGYSRGNRGLGPNATSAAPTGAYWDWQLGADYAIRNTPLTVNLSWIDTDISRREAAYLQPSFSKGQDGRGSIAGSTLFASLTAAF